MLLTGKRGLSMRTKGMLAVLLLLCLLLAGCRQTGEVLAQNTPSGSAANVESQTDDGKSEAEDKNSESAAETSTSSNPERRSDVSAVSVVPNETATPGFDLEKKAVTLNSGHEMPILGIGTYALSDSEAENSTYWALKAGFRLIDTARIYGNEAAVGRGLQRAIDEGIVTREEVFITTKMWTSDFSNGDAAIDAALERLGLEYIDLMILHHS